jgi:hypothetical protein
MNRLSPAFSQPAARQNQAMISCQRFKASLSDFKFACTHACGMGVSDRRLS